MRAIVTTQAEAEALRDRVDAAYGYPRCDRLSGTIVHVANGIHVTTCPCMAADDPHAGCLLATRTEADPIALPDQTWAYPVRESQAITMAELTTPETDSIITLPSGVVGTPTGTVYGNTAAGLANPGVYWCIDFLYDALPPRGDSFVAGCATFSSGVGLVSANTLGSVGSTGRWVVTAESSLYTSAALHIPTTGEVGRHTRVQIWLADGRLRMFVAGEEIGDGLATAIANLGAGNRFGWNTRAGFAGTSRNDHLTFIQAWTSTVSPTRTQILEDALAPVGSLPVAGGASHRWLPKGGVGAVVSRFVDDVGGQDIVLSANASANVDVSPRLLRGLGTVMIMGDSRSSRPSGWANGDQWRRPFVQHVVAQGRDVAVMGSIDTGAATYDYDYRCEAKGGQAIGNANGVVAARIDSIETDRAAGVSATARLFIWYGANDRAIYCTTMGQNAATSAASFAADVEALIAGWRVRNTGTVYVIYGPPEVLDGGGVTQTIVDSELLSYQSMVADVAAWNTTHGNVVAVDAFGLFSLADPLYSPDGTHLTDLANDVLGAFIADVAMESP